MSLPRSIAAQVILAEAAAIEAQLIAGKPAPLPIEAGWQTWLRAVAPHTFTGSFAPFHANFWDWFWALAQKRRAGLPLTDDESVFLAIWARGQGKSSNVEWAAIAEGALVGKGYVLYVSGTEALAEEHVAAIRDRIEAESVARYYPGLANPQLGRHGNQRGWRQNFLITASGWAIRPIGLDVGVRGGRVGDQRPTLIVLDDVDSHDDSPLVVQKKLATISRAILPAGDRAGALVLGAQNLIHRNSVFNQIVTRRTSVLSRRIVSGPFPAFDGLEIETRQTLDGQRNVITAGRPTWVDFDLAACQKFLDDSGREAFLAEYQHDFAASEQGRVIPEYDESIHVITWSQFERVFGQRRIPAHWLCECGHDVGFTGGHLSAWTFIGTSAANSVLPGLRFRYRGITFNGVGVDEQAEHVKSVLWRGEQVQTWRMSHEALSERKTYREKYDLPMLACDSSKTAGISQWRHFLRPDRTKPHPFHEDEQLADGSYRLGFPAWFDVVDDDQLEAPRDDAGLMTHRRQTLDWRYRPDVLGVGGMSQNVPMKAGDDTNDSCRMVTATWAAGIAPLTRAERIDAALPQALNAASIRRAIEEQGALTPQQELALAIEEPKARRRVDRRRYEFVAEKGEFKNFIELEE